MNLPKVVLLCIVFGSSLPSIHAQTYEDAQRAWDAKQYERSTQLWLIAAEKGDAEAMNALGNNYSLGQGAPKSISEAMRWYRMGAERGNVNAQVNLAQMYESTELAQRDLNEAAKWYARAAAKGNVVAQYALALFHDKELTSTTRDPAEAVRLYGLAAEQGNLDAMVNLSEMLLVGRGAQRSTERGFALLQQAANKGSSLAQYNLAQSYFFGTDIPKNQPEAVALYMSAAKQGHVKATRMLSNAYALGQGVSRDYVEAFKWAAVAAAISQSRSDQAGFSEASDAASRLAQQMSPADVSEAQRQARAYIDTINAGRKK